MINGLAGYVGAAAFLLLAIVGPGISLQRLLRLRVDPGLVYPLGVALVAALHWSSLWTGQRWVFVVPIAALLLALAVPGRWAWADGPALKGVLPCLAAIVAFLAVAQYGWNRPGRDGAFVLDPLVPYDTAFHVGVTRELTLGYPPQVPGVSGFTLGYHLGSDLVRAAALRWAGVDPYDSLSRIDPTLAALALALLLRSLVQRIGGSGAAIALVPWTLLLTDLSWLLSWSPAAHWWTDLLRGNLLLSLAMANPIAPALALCLGALVALARHLDGEGGGYLVLAMLQAAAVPFFKVFLGAHLLLGLGAALVLAGREPRRALLLLAVPLGLATLGLVLGQGGRTVEVALAPFDLVRTTLETVGFGKIGSLGLAAWALPWLAASLGVRILGLGAAVRALGGRPVEATLAAMALAAWPLGLAFRVSAPEMLSGHKLINDAAYLVEQGGPLLWIFTALALAGLATRGRLGWCAAVVAVALSVPSSLQFAVEKNLWPNQALPAPMVRAMRALEQASDPGDVVLQRPGGRYPPAPVVLAGRRVPYERFTPWLTQFASAQELEARHAAVYTFFRTRDAAEAAAIARSLGARYVCLYGHERVRFEAASLLEPIFADDAEPAARVFRIRR